MPILYEQVYKPRRFSTSPEVKVTAQKKPTDMKIYLWNEAKTARMEDKTVYTGTKIFIRVGVLSTTEGRFVSPDPHVAIYRKINGGAYVKIWQGGWDVSVSETFDVPYVLNDVGIHTFYAEFPGNVYYAGCAKAVRTFAR